MSRLSKLEKTELGEQHAAWYRIFGKVAPRRKYQDDDSGSGAAGAVPPWEAHPLFMETPIGAPSDLSSILIADERTLDEAQTRDNESCPELKMQLQNALKNRLDYQRKLNIKPQPY